jgi:hypothetical protein
MAQTKRAMKIGDEAVKAKTGKGWVEWFKILDAAGAKSMKHAEIASHLHKKLNVPGWWCQMVAVQYEKERGLRAANQRGENDFNAGISRVVQIPLAKLYTAWADDNVRRSWLKGDTMEITTARKNKSIRAKWNESSRVSVMFYAKGPAKTQLVFDEFKIPNAEEAVRRKNFWIDAIAHMQKVLSN